MASEEEHTAMRRALAAADVPGWHDVNPRMGAVVLDPDGHELAVGHHRGARTGHAEGAVLELVGAAVRGSTVVVTMEPCHRVGRTPACTGLLLDAAVARMVSAVSGLDVDTIDDISRLPLVDVGQVGTDVRLTLGGVSHPTGRPTKRLLDERMTGRQ
jgi:pyrimidine deaminase RibD-like protein